MISEHAGWCEVNIYDILIPYPADWVIDTMGAWSQNRQFHLQMPSGGSQTIGILFTQTDLPIELADQATLVGDEISGPEPILYPNEINTSREIETFGNNTILTLTTNWGVNAIRRYFWLDQNQLVIFTLHLPQSEIGSVDYDTLFSILEEVISTVQIAR